ncbi:hypothetical protein [Cytobacillus praedii]|uniref:hypothetical protein n=1 Tax=Cytobacillus praedii TaxID=1742358 RepID=UPI002E1B6561|nr:hypothetical protein [Cytobacillus praedii]
MKNKGKQNGKSQFSGILIVLIAASLFSTLGVLANIAHKQGVSLVAFGAWREKHIFDLIVNVIKRHFLNKM